MQPNQEAEKKKNKNKIVGDIVELLTVSGMLYDSQEIYVIL